MMTQITLNAAVQAGAFFAGMNAGYYATEPFIHHLALKIVGVLSGFSETQIEKDYNIYEKQFALAKTISEMTEAREIFESKYGKYTLTACNVASIAAATISIISSAALARFLSPTVGFSLRGMVGIGVASMLTSLLTVQSVRILVISGFETLTEKELKSDFNKYIQEASQEDKLIAALEFKEKHGSSIFDAIKSSEKIAAMVTTFAISALAQYVSAK